MSKEPEHVLNKETLCGIWAGLPVAWTDDDRFDEDVYRSDVLKCCEAGVHGVYTGGSTGEFYAQDFDEFKAVTDATIDVCTSAGVPAEIGCTMTYTKGVIKRATYAQQKGAAVIQAALPYWFALTDGEVVGFFEDLAAACPNMPIMFYDNFVRAKRTITEELLKVIVDRVPALVGIKTDTSPAAGGREKVPAFSNYVSVFVPEHMLADMTPRGARGCCSAMVYMNPKLILHYYRLCSEGRLDEALPIQEKLKELLTVGLMPFTELQYADTAYDRMLGLVAGFLGTSYRTRKPYRGTCPEHVVRLRDWLARNFPAALDLEHPLPGV